MGSKVKKIETIHETLDGTKSSPNPLPIDPNNIGKVTITPEGAFEAGSFQTFKLVYTAGKYGIDDSGSLRICFRFASDQSKPQFEDPRGVNYTTITASNGAVLNFRYDAKGNVRPWDKTLYVKVVDGFLKEGDTITVVFGETSGGSPGMRLQTFCEDSYEFHTLIDPIATFCYQPVQEQPHIKIIPGKPFRYLAISPTICKVSEKFSIRVKGEDLWGNPSNQCSETFFLKSDLKINNLPDVITFNEGDFTYIIKDLFSSKSGDCCVKFFDINGELRFQTNPSRIEENPNIKYFWADLHGQSEETIGTGSAEQYFKFARDFAFLDATAHQGNDFQMSNEFWAKLDKLCEKFDVDDEFVAIPGYEWSGNTSLGGDRNVFFPTKGRKIRRSSHALINDYSDLSSDCDTARDLFDAFAANNEFDVLCYAHCGGRYADINLAHDPRFEKSVEVHSSWGTFEWLVEDAFKLGYRVGIVANSDGHKGRPGASYPGAGLFGAVGGLTCFLASELKRTSLMDCMRKRRHYATTGGPSGRPLLDLEMTFPKKTRVFNDDPRFHSDGGYLSSKALMGDIVHLSRGTPSLRVKIKCSSPLQRVDIFNGLQLLETIRPYKSMDLGRRIRVLWSGAEYRGRFRQVIWDGVITVSENNISKAMPVNFLNKDKKLVQSTSSSVEWKALTTGNIGGVDLVLEDNDSGMISIETPLLNKQIKIADIDIEDKVFSNNGVLPRELKVTRLPDINEHFGIEFIREIELNKSEDNPIFIRFLQEDGTFCWSSPIYVYR
ncbi:MAG: hypothetical protein P8M50_03970 [Paracoccaceae bacterium]|nr:hypothetical protein [Paracoccaceae bacterium]